MSSEISAGLTHRIESLIDDIETIRAELSHPGTDPSTGLAVPKVPVESVSRLKYTVDQFRLFLWAYLDTWPQGGSNPEARLRRIRMEAASDMLRLLTRDFSAGSVPPPDVASRLGEQLRAIASVMVDFRNQNPS